MFCFWLVLPAVVVVGFKWSHFLRLFFPESQVVGICVVRSGPSVTRTTCHQHSLPGIGLLEYPKDEIDDDELYNHLKHVKYPKLVLTENCVLIILNYNNIILYSNKLTLKTIPKFNWRSCHTF